MKLFLVLSCVVAVTADMMLVWWAKKDSHPLFFLIGGMTLLTISGYMWAYSMRIGNESAVAITFYALATVMGCAFLGIVIFKEPLSMINGIGMILGFIALIMVSIK
jgi:drug/metabolite transporter (DMT)-like permease